MKIALILLINRRSWLRYDRDFCCQRSVADDDSRRPFQSMTVSVLTQKIEDALSKFIPGSQYYKS
ncbi:unnamed protein product [Amoebophrya sp. A25]|nr:unnamed protein product [Amoebophrya sp. A25]|eukprot:GSA25T00006650001.1